MVIWAFLKLEQTAHYKAVCRIVARKAFRHKASAKQGELQVMLECQ
jgi:hypothetical protein